MRKGMVWLGKLSALLLAGIAGGLVGRFYQPGGLVHAQESMYGGASCMAAVPKSWGEFRGASEFGLVFEDENGTLRFLSHPPCGNLSTPSDITAIDLKVERK